MLALAGICMPQNKPIAAEDQRIDSWKEIAAFFGRDERTVKRWEKERGLPVHRVPGPRGSVFAYAGELSRWLHSNRGGQEDEPQPTQVEGRERSSQPTGTATKSVGPLPLWATSIAAVALLALACAFGLAIHRHLQAKRARAEWIGPMHTPDPIAREFYLKGRYDWSRRTNGSLSAAVDDFTQAVEHDSAYAEAYAGLAECYDVMPEFTSMPPSQAFPRAITSARTAIALDDSLANAHSALAFGLFYWEWNVPRALEEFHKAIALDPQNDEAHHWYATALLALGTQPMEAVAEIDKAQQLNPESRAIVADQALIRYMYGDKDGSVARLRDMERSEPDFASAPRYLAEIAWASGDDREWIVQTQRLAAVSKDRIVDEEVSAAEKGFAAGGDQGMLRALADVEQREFDHGQTSGYDLALTNTRLGQKEDAVAALKAAEAAHDYRIFGLESNLGFATLQGDPDFEALYREIDQRIMTKR